MNRYFLILVALSILSLTVSCSKDSSQPYSVVTVGNDNIYRDWTKKGGRKPAPKPGHILNKTSGPVPVIYPNPKQIQND